MSKVYNGIQWHEGMLLEPHHFQQMGQQNDLLALHYLTLACPYFWGVRKLTVDQAALVSGTFRITELDATFPDGSILVVNPDDPTHPEFDLKPLKETLSTASIPIHLAVMGYRTDAANVDSQFPRYDSIPGTPVVDENTGQFPVVIPRISLKLYIVVDKDVPSRYESFPIGEVFFKDEAYQLSDFIPPHTIILKNSPIYVESHAIIKSFRDKIAFLADQLQSPLASATSPLFATYQSYFNLLASQVTGLEALLATQYVHPFMIYKELATIAGHMCGLKSGQIPPVLNPYDHNNLKDTFTPLWDFITRMLELIKTISVNIAFDQNGKIFSLDLNPEWAQENVLILGIRYGDAMTSKDVMDWLSGAVIASESLVESVRDKRILGANRESVEQVPELGLLVNKGVVFVQVSNNPAFIIPGQNLKIFNIADTDKVRPQEIVLYVVNSSNNDT